MRAMLPAHLQGSINSPSSSPPKQMRQVGSSSSSSALSRCRLWVRTCLTCREASEML